MATTAHEINGGLTEWQTIDGTWFCQIGAQVRSRLWSGYAGGLASRQDAERVRQEALAILPAVDAALVRIAHAQDDDDLYARMVEMGFAEGQRGEQPGDRDLLRHPAFRAVTWDWQINIDRQLRAAGVLIYNTTRHRMELADEPA